VGESTGGVIVTVPSGATSADGDSISGREAIHLE